MWFKIIVACLPAAVVGLLFDEFFESLFYNGVCVALALILFGIGFIIIENRNKNAAIKIHSLSEITYETAFIIGLFQLIAAIFPGTSRSGATILGAMLLGVSRTTAAEFSFFLSAPVMFGASLIKAIKFVTSGVGITGNELVILIVGSVVAFLVSVAAIRFLLDYVRRHDFALFGYYRIILGAVVLIYFLL